LGARIKKIYTAWVYSKCSELIDNNSHSSSALMLVNKKLGTIKDNTTHHPAENKKEQE
jgi:hypothetical protein